MFFGYQKDIIVIVIVIYIYNFYKCQDNSDHFIKFDEILLSIIYKVILYFIWKKKTFSQKIIKDYISKMPKSLLEKNIIQR